MARAGRPVPLRDTSAPAESINLNTRAKEETPPDLQRPADSLDDKARALPKLEDFGILEYPREPKIPLTPDQDRVLQLVLGGENVFFTGPAGSGKSLILEHVKYHLYMRKRKYAVTAPTGIAAVQLNGTTIHSFAGVGIGALGLRSYVGMSMSTNTNTQIGKRKDAWETTEVLIIDEVSMV